MKPLVRYGNDIMAVWNPEDSLSDVILNAALSLARGLAAKKEAESEVLAAELTEMDDAKLLEFVALNIDKALES